MKVTYVYEVKEKTAINRKKYCSKCGSHVFKVMKQIQPDWSHTPDTGLMYHCECADCGHETVCRKNARCAIKSWKEDQ